MYELLWCLTFLINNFMLHLPSNRYLVVGLQGICAAQLEKLAGWHPRLNALLCWTVSATADLFFSLDRQVEDEAAAGLLVVSPVCGEKLHVRGWALPVPRSHCGSIYPTWGYPSAGKWLSPALCTGGFGNGHFQGTVHLSCSMDFWEEDKPSSSSLAHTKEVSNDHQGSLAPAGSPPLVSPIPSWVYQVTKADGLQLTLT